MSLLDQAFAKLERMVDQRIEGIAPFRATVASVSTGMVTIKRLGVTTAETELRARVVGFDLAVNDEVLCVMVAGKPVVVGQLQRAAAAAADYVLPSVAVGTSATTVAAGNHTHSPSYLVALGPFYTFNQAASATTQGYLKFLATATTVNSRQYNLDLQTTGEIVGMIAVAQASRTSGTCTMRVRKNSTDTPFASDACQLNGSNANSNAAWVAPGAGISFTGSDEIGVNFVSSSLAPTTLEIACWLYARLDPI